MQTKKLRDGSRCVQFSYIRYVYRQRRRRRRRRLKIVDVVDPDDDDVSFREKAVTHINVTVL